MKVYIRRNCILEYNFYLEINNDMYFIERQPSLNPGISEKRQIVQNYIFIRGNLIKIR